MNTFPMMSKRLCVRVTLAWVLLGGCATHANANQRVSLSDAASSDVRAVALGKIPTAPIGVTTIDPQFTIHALGNMCLDVGGQQYWAVGAPVTRYWCNNTVAQQFGVHDLSGAGHDVNLRIGSNFCVGIRGGKAVAGAVLELQICNGADTQQFALDGDSIMAGPSQKPTTEAIVIVGVPTPAYHVIRSFVWKPQNDVTKAKTPIVLAPRELTENEYLRFYTVDGSETPPHQGFVRPTDGPSLLTALQGAKWGTVVELANGVYDLTGNVDIAIPEGVTLRGYRKLVDNGPQITFNSDLDDQVFALSANDIRVTGLRFQGPTDSTDEGHLVGINIDDGWRVNIDHIEASRFPVAAIGVHGVFTKPETNCPNRLPAAPRPTPVNIARNFLHHNEGSAKGYGVISSKGAFPMIEGNTEYMNRHDVTADSQPETGYVANDNLVLSNYPTYYDGFQRLWDFDVHGSDPGILGTTFNGGHAADYVLIQYNTFLADDRTNVNIRGEPCGTQGLLDGNIFLQPKGQRAGTYLPVWIPEAVKTLSFNGVPLEVPIHFTVTGNNAFSAENPTDHLGTGDFDGDGIDDVFLGTGNAWFYSSGGASEWRFLRRNTETARDVIIGDLDGDGRADVVRVGKGGALEVSWGGVSEWQFLTNTPSVQSISNYVIGNFDGDRLHGDDIFTSSDGQWFIAPSGRNFEHVGSSHWAMKDLRFGDFTGDGITDVLGISGGQWSISQSARGVWTPLGGPTSDSLDGYFVADLDGDGIADVAREVGTGIGGIMTWKLQVSLKGTGPLNAHQSTLVPMSAVGRFEGGRRADALYWRDHQFLIGNGLDSLAQRSRQDMR